MLDDSKIKELRAPFPYEAVGLRIISTSKDRTSGLAVAYISARDVMNRLDAVFGLENWSHTVTPIGTYVGSLRDSSGDETIFIYQCTITVTTGSAVIEHQDVGEGTTPKAAVSDSLKRAAVHYGIGRYLYESDPVWVKIENRQIPKAERDRALKLMLGPAPSVDFAVLGIEGRAEPAKPLSAPEPKPLSVKPELLPSPAKGESKPLPTKGESKPLPAKEAPSLKVLPQSKPTGTLPQEPATSKVAIPKAEARQSLPPHASNGATPEQIKKITRLLTQFVPGDDALAREIRRTTVEGHLRRQVSNILDLNFAEAESLLVHLDSFLHPEPRGGSEG